MANISCISLYNNDRFIKKTIKNKNDKTINNNNIVTIDKEQTLFRKNSFAFITFIYNDNRIIMWTQQIIIKYPSHRIYPPPPFTSES